MVSEFQKGVEKFRENGWVGFVNFLPDAELDLVRARSGDVGKFPKSEGDGVGIDWFEVLVWGLCWGKGGREVFGREEPFD